MLKRSIVGSFLVIAAITSAQAQNTNSSQTVRPRTTTTNTNTNKAADPVQNTDVQKPATTPADGPSHPT